MISGPRWAICSARKGPTGSSGDLPRHDADRNDRDEHGEDAARLARHEMRQLREAGDPEERDRNQRRPQICVVVRGPRIEPQGDPASRAQYPDAHEQQNDASVTGTSEPEVDAQ